LPHLLARRSGQILVTASLAGYCGLPYGAPYGASKAALINLAESLRPELEARGVRLRVVNPGFVRSRLTDKNRFRMPYLMEPDQAARAVMRRLDREGFEIAFPSPLVWRLRLLRALPYRLFFHLTRRMLR
jgi:short-subunit dehydrogenase